MLQPLSIPTQVWSDISIDFVEGLPQSQGYTTISVMVNRFIKYVHFLPLKQPYTTKDMASIFAQEVMRLHEYLSTIVLDCDKIFMSSF